MTIKFQSSWPAGHCDPSLAQQWTQRCRLHGDQFERIGKRFRSAATIGHTGRNPSLSGNGKRFRLESAERKHRRCVHLRSVLRFCLLQYSTLIHCFIFAKDKSFISPCRCGRLAYFVPYPLSLLDPNQPILVTTVLSSYFDNPCASNCSAQTIPKTLARNWLHSKSSGLDFFPTPIQSSSSPQQPQQQPTQNDSNLRAQEVFSSPYNTHGNKPTAVDSPAKNSTTDCVPLTAGATVDNQPEDVQDSKKTFSMLSPWQIFRFFLTRHATKGSINNTTSSSSSSNDQSLRTASDRAPALSEHLSISSEISTLKSPETGRNQTAEFIVQPSEQIRCDQVDKQICIEFSTDRLLRGRLCCLNEGISSIGTGLGGGCKRFNKSKCNEMLPQIKCCLKNFSQLLKDYFQTHRNNST